MFKKKKKKELRPEIVSTIKHTEKSNKIHVMGYSKDEETEDDKTINIQFINLQSKLENEIGMSEEEATTHIINGFFDKMFPEYEESPIRNNLYVGWQNKQVKEEEFYKDIYCYNGELEEEIDAIKNSDQVSPMGPYLR